MHSTDPDRDAIFCEYVIRNEGKPDAHIIALIKAGIHDPAHSTAVTADNQMRRPEIQTALSVLRSMPKPEPTNDIPSREVLIAETDEIQRAAFNQSEFGHALTGVKIKAELSGHIKSGVNITTNNISITNMSDAELMKIAARAPIDAEFAEITDEPTGIATAALVDHTATGG